MNTPDLQLPLFLQAHTPMTCEGTEKHKCDLPVFCTHLFTQILMFAKICGGEKEYLFVP